MSSKKNKVNLNVSIFIIMIYLVMVTPQNAYAYIGPVSITILLQLLLAGIAGALVVARGYIALLFRKLLKRGKESGDK